MRERDDQQRKREDMMSVPPTYVEGTGFAQWSMS